MVAGPDLEPAQEALRVHWYGHLPDEADPDLAARDVAVDLDADEATCPACAEPFSPGSVRCTGCGLRLG